MIPHHRVLCRRVTNPRHHFGLNVSPGATPWRLQTARWKCEECEADERTCAAQSGKGVPVYLNSGKEEAMWGQTCTSHELNSTPNWCFELLGDGG